ncbi:MAG TPA: sigma-70 family RNA polymerase sigma factor [Verrucomicrobiae bacterium]|nr:sigma-70 family RNA polymerase sigma factor [Verrucomicrobiae bacterium]
MTKRDQDLLGEFASDQSQDAFTALVQRHLGLVYCAALRQVRSPQLAEEVAQSVFIDLARNAARLKPDTILTAWLYEVTRRTAINVVRGEARRQLREQIALEMNAMNATADDWTQIEPLLDDAMHALDDIDRTAILLRFFENKSLREVGENLGTTDDTARKRVNRAVERLREFLTKGGITVGASGLALALSTSAVQAAPVGLVATISTAAIAGTTIAATASAATIKTIAMTTLQKVLITATIIAVGVATPLVIQHQAKLRKENARTLSAQRQRAAPILALAASENDFPRESWAFRGYATPESALVSLVWAAVNSDLEGFLNSLSPEQQSRVRLRWQRQGLSDEAQFRNSISNQFGVTKRIRILNKEILSDSEVILRLQMEGEKGGTGTVGKKVQRLGNEWKIGATL